MAQLAKLLESNLEEARICQVCNVQASRYTCPRCNLLYCCLACYRNEKHRGCSESFYQKQYEEELKGNKASDEQRKATLEVLKRQRELQVEEDNLDDDSDSSDDQPDLSERLSGVNLDNPSFEVVWERLTLEERQRFDEIVKTGEISELIQPVEPWWVQVTKPIVALDESKAIKLPTIITPVPDLKSLTKAPPHPDICFNLIELLYFYCLLYRRYDCDVADQVDDVARELAQLSKVLMRRDAFTHQSISIAATECINSSVQILKMPSEACVAILFDVALLLPVVNHVMLALSDLHQWLQKKKLPQRKVVFYLAWSKDQPSELFSTLAQGVDAEARSRTEMLKQHLAAKPMVEQARAQQQQQQEQQPQQQPQQQTARRVLIQEL